MGPVLRDECCAGGGVWPHQQSFEARRKADCIPGTREYGGYFKSFCRCIGYLLTGFCCGRFQEIRRLRLPAKKNHIATQMSAKDKRRAAMLNRQRSFRLGSVGGDDDKKIQYRRGKSADTIDQVRCFSSTWCRNKMAMSNKFFHRIIVEYFEWTFATSFPVILISFLIGFLTMTAMFGLFFVIMGYVYNNPNCMGGGRESNFHDAFALSWTTFSTVGYGTFHPKTTPENGGGVSDCISLNLATAVESFIGILYAGFCSAVLFAKLLRARSSAQVSFSDLACIRYGDGVNDLLLGLNSNNPNAQASTVLDYTSSDDEDVSIFLNGDAEVGLNFEPSTAFPVLEFRLCNTKSNLKGGELLDARLQCLAMMPLKTEASDTFSVADINSVQSNTNLNGDYLNGNHNHAHHRRNRQISSNSVFSTASGRRARISQLRNTAIPNNGVGNNEQSPPYLTENCDEPSSSNRSTSASRRNRSLNPNQRLSIVEGYPSSNVEKRVFHSLELEAPEHPFLDRAWLVRHTLDSNSPLLNRRTKSRIRRNGDRWPAHLNNDIRSAMNEFSHIIVSLSATSNTSATTVYSQKVYRSSDVVLGYKFAEMFYRDVEDNLLKVDPTYISDIVEQDGNHAGEPLYVSNNIATGDDIAASELDGLDFRGDDGDDVSSNSTNNDTQDDITPREVYFKSDCTSLADAEEDAEQGLCANETDTIDNVHVDHNEHTKTSTSMNDPSDERWVQQV